MAKKVLAASGVSLLVCLAVMVIIWILAGALTDVGAQPEQPQSDEAAAQLEQARQCVQEGDHEQAEAIYEAIIADYPGTDYALEAYKQLVTLYISTRRYADSQDTLDAMITDFSEHPGLPGALHSIGQNYEIAGRFQEAKTVFEEAVIKYEDPSSALEAQKGVVMMCIWLNDDAQIVAAFAKLNEDFSGDVQGYPRTLYDIARRYEMVDRFADAKSLYEQIMELCPDLDAHGSYASRARLGVPKNEIFSYIEAGDDDSAFAALDELLADFAGHEYVPAVVFRVAEQYYKRATNMRYAAAAGQTQQRLQNALAIWEFMFDDFPDADLILQAHYYAAGCYRRLGEYQKSTASYETVYAGYSHCEPDAEPGYIMAWNSLFLQGRNYEALKESGGISISKAEADQKIKAAYQQLLDRYPDCPATGHARRWLSCYNSK
jgi:tetratricopeptide (TPR) repeat protein